MLLPWPVVKNKVVLMAEPVCLIVDDEPAIRGFLRLVLKRRQLQSVEAENATDALRIIHKLGGRLDMILSDITMPGEMDGVDLAHSVRNTFPAIPVILFSGYKNAGDAEGFEFIPKPFVPEAILDAVDRAMARRPEQVLHAGSDQ
jgi:DNA-binding NtrC family response regulator